MREFISNLIERIRSIQWREIKPWQIALFVIGAIISGYIGFVVVQSALWIPLLALLGVVIVYQVLDRREKAAPKVAAKDQAQQEFDSTRQGFKSTKQADDSTANASQQQAAREATPPAEEETVEDIDTSALEDPATFEELVIEEPPEFKLGVEQVVNPETGFREPDIKRLEQREEEKLSQAQQVNDDIKAQIEARRKRLLEQRGDNE